MAITKILPVRGQLKGCLDYAANPQKTEYFSTADMQRLIGYTQNTDACRIQQVDHRQIARTGAMVAQLLNGFVRDCLINDNLAVVIHSALPPAHPLPC